MKTTELEVIDAEKTLTAPQMKFARLVGGGMRESEAWERAGLGEWSKFREIQLMRHPGVEALVAEVREDEAKGRVLTVREKREFLAGVVRTVQSQLTPDSVYARDVQYFDGEANVKGFDKLKAMELDAKLAGDFDHGDGGGGVIAEFIARIRVG